MSLTPHPSPCRPIQPQPVPCPSEPWGRISLLAVPHNEGKDHPPSLAAGLFFSGIRDHKGARMPPRVCPRVGVCGRMRVPVRVFDEGCFLPVRVSVRRAPGAGSSGPIGRGGPLPD